MVYAKKIGLIPHLGVELLCKDNKKRYTMRLLFIQGGSRLKLSDKGLWYTDPNFTDEVWNRYIAVCDHLTILLRRETNIYKDDECRKRFNPIPVTSKVDVIPLEDNTKPKMNLLNIFMNHRIKKAIYTAVYESDKVIIRSASYYTKICMDACLLYKKPYLMEVTGFAKEGMSNHSMLGKLSANYFEKLTKQIAHNAEAAIYVTDEALQKRYPCKKMLGCSDVVLQCADDVILKRRLNKISEKRDGEIIRIGTAAFLDVKWKGQQNVIMALFNLKQRGVTNIHYEMIGTGRGYHLIKLVKKLGLEKQVKILGAYPHEQVFNWLDNIDIYIQPSYQEGLCRAIVEAISRACPVIASDAGGNYELINNDYIFPRGDYMKLASLIEKIIHNCKNEAIRNFEHSKYYNRERLDSLRNIFFKEFIGS